MTKYNFLLKDRNLNMYLLLNDTSIYTVDDANEASSYNTIEEATEARQHVAGFTGLPLTDIAIIAG